MPHSKQNSNPVNEDYYLENGLLVFTEKYHLKRGHCCGSGCRHCPYEPRHRKGNKTTKASSGKLSPG